RALAWAPMARFGPVVRESRPMIPRFAALALLAALPALGGDHAPTPLPRSAPEAQGIPSPAIKAFLEAAEAKIDGLHTRMITPPHAIKASLEAAEAKIDALHSVMILRHGVVVAEGWWAPYEKDDPHVMFSLSKSFTSTGIGLAADEGKLTLDDPVLPYFPEDAPAEPSPNLKAMRVRDLLAMSTGQHTDDLQKFSFT